MKLRHPYVHTKTLHGRQKEKWDETSAEGDPKFGFIPPGQWNIKAPFDVPANAFMAIELIPDGLKGVKGTVKYPIEFDGV